MSQHSASPRLEALESSVSEIQETMSELVGMLRQLTTETRTAGDGRRGEESGGARRDAAHIYSSGTRRGPLTAATGYRVTAVQDEGAGEATAARNFPVHHRAASEPADTRPGLPTGVGPMIDVRSGEARDPYLAETLQAMKNRDRDEIIRMVSTRHSNLPQKKGAQRTSRQPEQAFVSSESGNRSGARRGRDRRGGGRQGRGRRVNNGDGGGNNNSSGTPGGGQVVLLEPSGAAMVAVTRAAAATAATTSPLAAVSAADREATGGKTARRGRATSYSDVTGAQVTIMRRVPAHRTRQYLWWSCRYPKKTSPWKPRRSRFRRQASAV